MTQTLDPLGRDVLNAVKSSALRDLFFDYAEVAIDVSTNAELLKDIPGVSSIRALFSAGSSISDKLLGRKIRKFLIALESISVGERVEMVSRLEADQSFGRSVGIHVIELLDRVSEHKKPEMLARAFSAYAQRHIDLLMLQRINVAIERLPDCEMKHLRKFQKSAGKHDVSIDDTSITMFLAAGLASSMSAYDGSVYRPTAVCDTFLLLDLDLLTE